MRYLIVCASCLLAAPAMAQLVASKPAAPPEPQTMGATSSDARVDVSIINRAALLLKSALLPDPNPGLFVAWPSHGTKLGLIGFTKQEVLMRTILGLVLTIAVVSGASAADLDDGYSEPDVVDMEEVYAPPPPRHVVRNKRIPCVTCRGARLPYGGLRKSYEATLPWGGLPEDCPPEFVTSQTVLVRKF